MSKRFNSIDVISWIITVFVAGMIMYLEMRNIFIRLVWNDISRTCTSESIITYINEQIRIILMLIVASITANFVGIC